MHRLISNNTFTIALHTEDFQICLSLILFAIIIIITTASAAFAAGVAIATTTTSVLGSHFSSEEKLICVVP